jgi:coenzyme F420-reducing hydrogenase alpha subunit
MSNTRTIKVDYLARVEGEGALHVKVRGDRVEEVHFKIFEPPRLFEAVLRGRMFHEVADITARICGICPIAYQMSAVHAIEDAFGIRIEGALRELRRLVYCGEWIESHTLHVAMLHAPDFLGYEDAIRMAKDHPHEVQRALDLKKAGNEIVRVIGGREIHAVNVRVGGFYRAPTRAELAPLVGILERAREHARGMLRWVSTFDVPDFDYECEFVALRHPSEYPFNEGRLVSNRGLDIAIRQYDEHFVEEQVPYSNALHSTHQGHGAYIVGPMARYSLNFDRLPASVQRAARAANLSAVCRNPFQSIVVRAVEVLYAVEEALRIIAEYEPPAQPVVPVEVREGSGTGCTEAPRGILVHRYRLNADGTIGDAKIVPPTSQNQKAIEADLRRFVEQYLQVPKSALTWKCEQAIRNYDPCISCATHFLKLQIDRLD